MIEAINELLDELEGRCVEVKPDHCNIFWWISGNVYTVQDSGAYS